MPRLGGENMKQLKKGDTITILGRRWFERVNGNTYHSVKVYVNGILIDKIDYDYGYGSQYLQNGQELLAKYFDLGLKKYDNGMSESLWHLKDKGITIIDDVVDVQRKKDL